MLGKESKCCSTGEEMAERVSIRDDITSEDAGFTWTRFKSLRLSLRWEAVAGKESRRASRLVELKDVLAEVLSGMTGPLDVSNMVNGPVVKRLGTERRLVSACSHARAAC